jgi:putative membrane protein
MKESIAMADQTTGNTTEQLSASTRLAYERTRGAYERTMMAWVRTGTSLITFGFAVYKFFQLEMAGAVVKSEGLIETSLIGPREFGLILIGIGLLSIMLGTYEHRRDLGALCKEYPGMPRSGTQLVALLMATFGVLALVGVIYRF